ncbi:uncharacterized protein V1510DRAFT_422304 [Dipodascopsis tothii]|uniref:uncharacterized protein n=1 Tax=Dipodascopsis tothii TaxID=44089 RepID=UPI0034CFFC55
MARSMSSPARLPLAAAGEESLGIGIFLNDHGHDYAHSVSSPIVPSATYSNVNPALIYNSGLQNWSILEEDESAVDSFGAFDSDRRRRAEPAARGTKRKAGATGAAETKRVRRGAQARAAGRAEADHVYEREHPDHEHSYDAGHGRRAAAEPLLAAAEPYAAAPGTLQPAALVQHQPQYARIFNSPIQYAPFFHTRTSTGNSSDMDFVNPAASFRRPPYAAPAPMLERTKRPHRRQKSARAPADAYDYGYGSHLLSSPPTSAGAGRYRRSIKFSISDRGYASVDVEIVAQQDSPDGLHWDDDDDDFGAALRYTAGGYDQSYANPTFTLAPTALWSGRKHAGPAADAKKRRLRTASPLIRYNATGGKEKPHFFRRPLLAHSSDDESDHDKGYASDAETIRALQA